MLFISSPTKVVKTSLIEDAVMHQVVIDGWVSKPQLLGYIGIKFIRNFVCFKKLLLNVINLIVFFKKYQNLKVKIKHKYISNSM